MTDAIPGKLVDFCAHRLLEEGSFEKECFAESFCVLMTIVGSKFSEWHHEETGQLMNRFTRYLEGLGSSCILPACIRSMIASVSFLHDNVWGLRDPPTLSSSSSSSSSSAAAMPAAAASAPGLSRKQKKRAKARQKKKEQGAAEEGFDDLSATGAFEKGVAKFKQLLLGTSPPDGMSMDKWVKACTAYNRAALLLRTTLPPLLQNRTMTLADAVFVRDLLRAQFPEAVASSGLFAQSKSAMGFSDAPPLSAAAATVAAAAAAAAARVDTPRGASLKDQLRTALATYNTALALRVAGSGAVAARDAFGKHIASIGKQWRYINADDVTRKMLESVKEAGGFPGVLVDVVGVGIYGRDETVINAVEAWVGSAISLPV
jgi:hypothetical protein